jgi:hypothetical protein
MCAAHVRLGNIGARGVFKLNEQVRGLEKKMSADSGGKNQGESGHVGATRQKGGEGARGGSGAKSEGKGTGNKSEGSGKKSGTPGGERHHD